MTIIYITANFTRIHKLLKGQNKNNIQTRMTTSISSKAFEKKAQKAKE